MKEKLILSLSVIFIIGIAFISKNNQDSNLELSLIHHAEPEIVNDYQIKSIDEMIMDEKENGTTSEITQEIASIKSSDSCSLNSTDTDSFTFNNAFKYYRNCLNAHENFLWRGKTYTTMLDMEKDMHLTDSIKTKKQNEEISEKE